MQNWGEDIASWSWINNLIHHDFKYLKYSMWVSLRVFVTKWHPFPLSVRALDIVLPKVSHITCFNNTKKILHGHDRIGIVRNFSVRKKNMATVSKIFYQVNHDSPFLPYCTFAVVCVGGFQGKKNVATESHMQRAAWADEFIVSH